MKYTKFHIPKAELITSGSSCRFIAMMRLMDLEYGLLMVETDTETLDKSLELLIVRK